MSAETELGIVTHYFGKIGVAAIRITEGVLAVGDTIHVKGHTADFTANIDSIQFNGETVRMVVWDGEADSNAWSDAVNWSGDAASFGEIVRACDSPVVIAGGTVISDAELLTRFEQGREVGAIGCSVGRNIFQYKKPGNMIKAISQLVHKGFSVVTAAEALKEDPIESSIFGGTVIW
mgnify:CR=1 FL=1